MKAESPHKSGLASSAYRDPSVAELAYTLATVVRFLFSHQHDPDMPSQAEESGLLLHLEQLNHLHGWLLKRLVKKHTGPASFAHQVVSLRENADVDWSTGHNKHHQIHASVSEGGAE